MAMLACARIGAIHSVVFSGFSADALRDRIVNCNSKFVFTADGAMRGGKKLKLKPIVDEALNGLDDMKVFVTLRTNDEMNMVDGRDLLMAEEMKKVLLSLAFEKAESVTHGCMFGDKARVNM
jgi:acetyl-CoA synthetase